MSREEAMLAMLEAAAKLQYNIALILEAKAVEAEKARSWLCQHLSDASFALYGEQLKKSLEIHDQLIEVIDGLTKMESGLTRNLEVVLNKGEPADGQGASGFGDMFGGGGFGGFTS
jgi:hypothetical protein